MDTIMWKERYDELKELFDKQKDEKHDLNMAFHSLELDYSKAKALIEQIGKSDEQTNPVYLIGIAKSFEPKFKNTIK